ncbi:MAG: hypothetical protein QNK03_27905 [Myxococcota bacterium]|nr:hypothetical protein [Myxococcota bacterium]
MMIKNAIDGGHHHGRARLRTILTMLLVPVFYAILYRVEGPDAAD